MKRVDSKASDILVRALDRIAYLENKTKQIVYDEIGYALGRQGSSAVQYWVYHRKVPSKLDDVENLARVIAQRNGWEAETDLRAYLEYSDHPSPDLLARQLMGNAIDLDGNIPLADFHPHPSSSAHGCLYSEVDLTTCYDSIVKKREKSFTIIYEAPQEIIT